MVARERRGGARRGHWQWKPAWSMAANLAILHGVPVSLIQGVKDPALPRHAPSRRRLAEAVSGMPSGQGTGANERRGQCVGPAVRAWPGAEIK